MDWPTILAALGGGLVGGGLGGYLGAKFGAGDKEEPTPVPENG